MSHLLYCFLVLLLPFVTVAQDSLPAFQKQTLFIKWSPLSLLEPESILQIGSEFLLTNRTSIQVEVGYGPPLLRSISPLNNQQLDNRQAWRLRTECRLYRQRDTQKGRYWALEGFVMTVNGTNSVFIDTFYGGMNAPVSFPIHKRVVGGHVKAGIQRPIGHSNRFYFDFYAGLGGRYNDTFAESVDGVRYIHPVGGLFDLYRPIRRLSASVTIGIKLACRLN